MKRRPPLSPEQKDLISEMRERGLSCRAIGDDLGISEGAVSWHCLMDGIESPHTATTPVTRNQPMQYQRNGFEVRRFTDDDDKQLLELEAAGVSYTEIGRRMGRRHNSIIGRLATLARREAREEARRQA